MNILLLSNPTPNNVLAQKILASHHCNNLFIQSNHPAANTLGTTVSININDFAEVEAFCIAHQIGLVVIHHIELLKNGLFDFLNDEQREWKGIVTGCSKNVVTTNNTTGLATLPIITDGKNYFVLIDTDTSVFESAIQNMLLNFQQQSNAVNGFLQIDFEYNENTYFVKNISPCLANEDAVLNNLETDLVSIFAAAYNGTFEDVNVEFN